MPTYPPIVVGAAVQVNVTYHNAPVGASGTHSIRYLGVGLAAGTHTGYLDYSYDHTALSIHTMSATPGGSRLGSLLLYEAAGRAAWVGVNRIVALAVAATARPFYLACGFHPARSGRLINEAIVPTPAAGANFALRLALARNAIPNWEAERTQVLNASFAEINGVWI